jgi:hypothetical protein
MAVNITLRTREIIEHLFGTAKVPLVEQLLIDECGSNLPLYKPSTPEGLERVQFAVLKLSRGDDDKLLETILLAKRDWRDVLVWAGFGNDLDAHNQWAKDLK